MNNVFLQSAILNFGSGIIAKQLSFFYKKSKNNKKLTKLKKKLTKNEQKTHAPLQEFKKIINIKHNKK
jgi:ATP-dependent DNA ligase